MTGFQAFIAVSATTIASVATMVLFNSIFVGISVPFFIATAFSLAHVHEEPSYWIAVKRFSFIGVIFAGIGLALELAGL